MLNVFFIWFLKLFYNTRNNFKILQRVLRIKIKTPMKIVDNKKGTDKERSNKFHLALRLNNDQSEELSKQAPLFELIEYVHKAFNTKYLTIIVGPAGFEREIEEVNVGNDISSIDQTAQIQISLYHNYQLIYSPLTPDINVNLIDDNDDMHSHSDSRSLFLLKLREFLYSDSEKVKVMSEIYEAALKNFTNFPSIDLYICMTRSLDFTQLFPLHLGFTHFYCCPVLATQSYSKEAITEGFECFDRTKQNFGK